jgi:hypothetical protein
MKRRSTNTLTSPKFEISLNILLILYTLCGGTNKLQNTKHTQKHARQPMFTTWSLKKLG